MNKKSPIRRLTATGPTWGWLAGITYYSWVATFPGRMPFWAYLLLIVLGPLFALSVIGGITGFIAEYLAQLTSSSRAKSVFYVLDGLVAAIVSFFAAGLALWWFSRIAE